MIKDRDVHEKPVIAVSDRCAAEPGFEAWREEALKHFRVLVYQHPPVGVFLTIDSRVMQFRGDWSTWWLSPGNLKNFKPWNEGQQPCEEANASAPPARNI